jgi:hypothetical protein
VRQPRFDAKRPLVAARDFTFMGVEYKAGAPFGPFDEGTVSRRMVERQYEARAVNMGDAEAVAADPVQMVPGPKNGSYTITAPWLAEPEVVRGKVNAEKRLAALREAGAPLGFIEGGSAVTVEEGEGGGWYVVDAPWLDEPEKVQGREAAEARQQELHAAGEPDSYKGYTLTEGENGWWKITKDGVEADPPVSLNVQGEENARRDIATLRAGELIEGAAMPAEWAPAEEETTDEETDEEQPDADSDVEGAGNDAPEDETVDDTNKDKDQRGVDTAPNEPGTNEPNGAEVINDEANAEGAGKDGDGGDGGTTRPVGP